MTYDFSSMFSLYDTLNNVMYDYEEEGNENALRQFFHAATAVSPRSQPIGCFDVYEDSDAVLEFVRWFYATTPCSGIEDCTDALYLHLEQKIGFSEAEQIDLPTILRVLEAVDELFSLGKFCIYILITRAVCECMLHKVSVGTVCLPFGKQQFSTITLTFKRCRENKIRCLFYVTCTKRRFPGIFPFLVFHSLLAHNVLHCTHFTITHTHSNTPP